MPTAHYNQHMFPTRAASEICFASGLATPLLTAAGMLRVQRSSCSILWAPLCFAERRGEIIVVSGEAIRYNPALVEKEAAGPSERHLKGEAGHLKRVWEGGRSLRCPF